MKKAVIAVATIVVLPGLTWLVVRSLASSAESGTDRAWSAIETRESFARRFPPIASKNESARKLEELALAAGIAVTPRTDAKPELPAAAQSKTNLIKKPISDFLTREIESPKSSVGETPPALADYLRDNRVQIDAVADHLVSAGVPRWPLAAAPDPQQQLPNLLGHMILFRVLTASSLDAGRGGESARAWHYQEAAWHLAQGLLDRSELISQLIGVAGVRMMNGAQRKLEPPVPAWVAGMRAFAYRKSMVSSVHGEWLMASSLLDRDRAVDLIRGDYDQQRPAMSMLGSVRDVVLRPYYRWAISTVWSATIDDIRAEVDVDPCSVAGRDARKPLEDRIPPLAKPGALAVPNLVSAIERAALLEVEVEGTAAVLHANELRSADGTWPQGVPDARSTVCRGQLWKYSPGPPARVRFTATPYVPASYKGARVPVEFVAE